MTWADHLILMPVSFLSSESSQSTGLLLLCALTSRAKGILTKGLEYKGVNSGSANFNFVTDSYVLCTYIKELDTF